MKAVLVGDIHLSDRPPSIRTDTYADDILDKLAQAVTLATEHADVVVLLGDVFHVKTPSRTSHRLVMRTAEVLEAFRGPVLIVPGNHDMSQDRLDSLPGQPLGTLALSPNITLLDQWSEWEGIYGIPYLNDLDEFCRHVASVADDPGIVLIATHQSIFPPGEHPPYPHLNADVVAAHEGTVPIAYGHIHDPHGAYLANGVWFCNNGAISRGSLHEQTLKREPKVTLFDSEAEGCPFATLPLRFKPADQVFRLAEHRDEVARVTRLDDFLTSIGAVSLNALSIEEILSHAAVSGLSEQAKTELAEIVERAG